MEESRFAQFTVLIASAAKSIQRLKIARMEQFHLSAAHTNCLCRLAQSPSGLTQRELSRLENVDRAQISRVLRELGERGYVLPGAQSGYKSRYRLTALGAQTADEIQSIIREINQFVSGQIPQTEIDSFYGTFKTITENLSKAVRLYGEPPQTIPEGK